MPYLKADAYSSFTVDHCYGKKGQEVKIKSRRNNVVMVESYPGVIFPLLDTEISDDPIVGFTPSLQPAGEQPKKMASGGKSKWSKSAERGLPNAPTGQASLF